MFYSDFFIEPSASLIFINLLMLLSVLLLMKKALKPPYYVNKPNRTAAILLLFLFVTFSFWGADWFHYQDIYKMLLEGDPGHTEQIYVWIAKHLSFDYLSFRFVIWGFGLILVLSTIKRLPINQDLAILFFGSIWIIWFSYARVSLSMALSIWGLSLFLVPWKNKRLLSMIIAIIAIWGSIYFHKSSYFMIFVIALTFLSLYIKRTGYVVALLSLMVLFYLYAPSLIGDFLAMDVDADSNLSQTISTGRFYMEGEGANRGLGAVLLSTLEHIPYYLIGAQCLLFITKKGKGNLPSSISFIMRMTVLTILFALLFRFNNDYTTYTVFVRFLRFAHIPCAILLAYFWETKAYPKLTRITFYMALLSTFYAVGYSYYCAL